MHENCILPPHLTQKGSLPRGCGVDFGSMNFCLQKLLKVQGRGGLFRSGANPPLQTELASRALAPIGKKAQPATALRSCQKAEAVTVRGAGSGPRPVVD